ncbi:MAG: bifunctional adenosylcobinamide kinase/adenosylcobinamide-phosphate guanylyltransferase [Spirochaetaceae bacterium]|nr:bifunctional adenosylcobinamide kinase/adenosylcobinamide-phosphate guanylyltransferase [Spirochaetaceae bacterium]
MITLITGGIKSGKSKRALDLAALWNSGGRQPAIRASFIATAEALDDEMKIRIEKHKAERAGRGFDTIEEPFDLAAALSRSGSHVIVDCLTMWVNNMMYHKREADFEDALGAFISELRGKQEAVIVSNETGLGNIPADELTRRYNLMLAAAARRTAEAADHVEFMVAGLPLTVK